MVSTRLTRSIRSEARALATAAELGLDAAVPRYPGWSVLDLVCHTGDVHRWVADMIQRQSRERVHREPLGRRVKRSALMAWFGEGAERLVNVLEAADPAAAVWTLTDDGSVAFWHRRMAHETAMHRWDAQSALGIAEPIPSWLALSGILESLALHLPRGDDRTSAEAGGRLRLKCLDETGDWVLSVLPSAVLVETIVPAASVDATIEGTASELWLLLTGRSYGELAVSGDSRVVERLEAALRLVAVPRLG